MKYYQVMEIVDNSVGAKFYYIKEDEIDELLKTLQNNYDIDEISKEEYDEKQKKIYRKIYYNMTGHLLSEAELKECIVGN